jgi:hypothetical protein
VKSANKSGTAKATTAAHRQEGGDFGDMLGETVGNALIIDLIVADVLSPIRGAILETSSIAQ